MRTRAFVVGLLTALAATPAIASPGVVLYDTITGGQNPSDTDAVSLTPGNGLFAGPLGDSFGIGSDTLLKSVTVRAFDPGDPERDTTGSLLVYLVPTDPARIAPWTNGTATSNILTGATLLGTIADSLLPKTLAGCALTACNTTINTNPVSVTFGTYWIELVSSGMTGNGGNGSVSNAEWESTSLGLSGTTGGIGTLGEYVSWQNLVGGLSANNLVSAPNNGSFELTLTGQIPEPTSLALLGAGLMGLGFGRRRRTQKPAE
jgi:hypothetical protein